MLALCALTLSACAATYVASWKDPEATPLEFAGQKVVAVVLMKDVASRRIAEDTLAREITARGAQGIAMYTLSPDIAPAKEAATREAVEKSGAIGVVVMRPINVENELVITPVTSLDPGYRSYWGGYYGYGAGTMWSGPTTIGNEISSNTVVTVETVVYSLKQNKLVWSGKSKTTNPPKTEKFVQKLAANAADELKKLGLIKK
jgi:hypothetical protein